MNTLKTTIYIIGFIVLLIILFFKKYLPSQIADVSGIITGILLLLIIILELITRKKNEK